MSALTADSITESSTRLPSPARTELLLTNVLFPLVSGCIGGGIATIAELPILVACAICYATANVIATCAMMAHRQISMRNIFIHLFAPITLANDAKQWMVLIGSIMSNRLFTTAFLTQNATLSTFPRVRAKNLTELSPEDVTALSFAAQSTPLGVATMPLGPFSVLCIATNAARRALIRESRVGVTDESVAKTMQLIFDQNQVMKYFLLSQPNNSDAYKKQREFLVTLYHRKADMWLYMITTKTNRFLENYAAHYGQIQKSLREVINLLVLHNSSHLLGLTDYPLDQLFLESAPDVQHAINEVAHYGITERGDPAFEEKIYAIFLTLFEKNFACIQSGLNHTENTDQNLIRNLFASRGIPFPERFEDFHQLDKEKRYSVAMGFISIGLGGMVHSTTNTLDWALARLLADPEKMCELTQLLRENDIEDYYLQREDSYDKDGGILFPLAEWVLHNVFLYPPFALEAFFNPTDMKTTLNGSEITVPGNTFFMVNYRACNAAEKLDDLNTFSTELLRDKNTILNFWNDQRVSSFGGSLEGGKSRKCPAARTSLLEQIIAIAVLLRDFNVSPSGTVSCEIDHTKSPLCTRVNEGMVTLERVARLTHTTTSTQVTPLHM